MSFVFSSCLINTFRFAPCKELKNPIEVEFCNLPKYDSSKLLKVRCSYSGVDEYWGLIGFNCKEDSLDYGVHLDYDFDNYPLRNNLSNYFFNKRIKILYKNGKNKAELELIGNFYKAESFEPGEGFGHLGLQKYNFAAKYIRVIRITKKIKNKKSL